MKREDLKALELTDSQIDSVLDRWHSEIQERNNQIAVLKQEKEGLDIQVNELSETIKQYDGINLDELKSAPETLKAQYEERINKLLKDNAVKEALQGVKHSGLLMKEIDYDKLTIQDGQVNGINEQVDSLKATYSDLFETPQVKGAKPINSNTEPHGLTREQIMAISDREQRQKAIQENIELFD